MIIIFAETQDHPSIHITDLPLSVCLVNFIHVLFFVICRLLSFQKWWTNILQGGSRCLYVSVCRRLTSLTCHVNDVHVTVWNGDVSTVRTCSVCELEFMSSVTNFQPIFATLSWHFDSEKFWFRLGILPRHAVLLVRREAQPSQLFTTWCCQAPWASFAGETCCRKD